MILNWMSRLFKLLLKHFTNKDDDDDDEELTTSEM